MNKTGISLMAMAAVPPVTLSDFGGEAAEMAHPLWLILAGEGLWGAIVVGLVGLIYRFARPFVISWMEERRLAKLYLSVEACVAQSNAQYVEGMKAANADGKLTKEEAEYVFAQCRANLIEFMRTQGVDIVKEYGGAFVDGLIELLVSRLKNPALKAVIAPLSGSASAPLPELDPARLG